MVLSDDAASPAASDFASDSSPASDADQYSSSFTSSDSSQVNIDASNLKHPAPFFGALFGYTTPDLVRFVNGQVQYTSKVIKRPLNQDEATAVAFWSSKAYSMTSYGPPLGFAMGFYRAYSTQSTYRFPFLAPKAQKFNPNKLFTLEGRRAQLGWHSLRWTAYGLLGSWFGKLLFFSYALTVRMVGERGDPRLKNVIKAEIEFIREARKSPAIVQQGQSNASNGLGDIDESAERLQRSDGFYSDLQMQETESRQQPPVSRGGPENRASAFQIDKVASQPRSFEDDLDDASPTAQSFDSNANTNPESGSAWGRIRNQSDPPSSPNGNSANRYERRPPGSSSLQNAWAKRRSGIQKEQQEGSIIGDSHTFPKSEEDRQLARQEAQKEFDDRVERERQGGDFDRSNPEK
ncbi:MAG: hypothetical protein M1837_000392 [Sclerophora amabilis]|nr:MAG: hypothetical protein M1837_000392 [Sclerophora amabilis]